MSKLMTLVTIFFLIQACQPRLSGDSAHTKQVIPDEAIKNYEDFMTRLSKIKEKLATERELDPKIADIAETMFALEEEYLKIRKQLAEVELRDPEDLEAVMHAYIRVVEGSDSSIEKSELLPAYPYLKSLINKK